MKAIQMDDIVWNYERRFIFDGYCGHADHRHTHAERHSVPRTFVSLICSARYRGTAFVVYLPCGHVSQHPDRLQSVSREVLTRLMLEAP